MGQLYWMTAGVDLDSYSDMMVKAFSPQFREVHVVKKQTFLTDGIRVDVRTSKSMPDTFRWTLVHLFHRGRVLEFRFWTQASNWYLHAPEVEDLLKSIALIHPEGRPLLTGAFISKQHGYQLDLPPGWSFLEVDPPEGRIVGRFWSGRGMPAGMILRVDLELSASEYMDKYTKELQSKNMILEQPKRSDSDEEVSTELISQFQNVRYKNFDRVFRIKGGILQCDAWAPVQATPEVHSTIKGIVASFLPTRK